MNQVLKIVVAFCLLAFAAPFFTMSLFGVAATGYTFQMMGMVYDTRREMDEENRSDFNGVKVVPAGEPGVRALRNFAEFDRTRAVSIDTQMTLAEIRRGDDTPIPPDGIDSYLAGRAPIVARAECDMIVAAFASKCVVTRLEARRLDSGSFQVGMILTFIQREAFGNVAPADQLNYIEVPLKMNGGEAKPIRPSNSTAERKKFYASVAKDCLRIRKENDNCAIHTVRITSYPDAKSAGLTVQAESRYSVLQ